MLPPVTDYTLFVSCVVGRPVTRWGTKTLIGAERQPSKPTEIQYFPKLIVAIPAGEHARYRKEYDRNLKDGDLVVRTGDEWLAQAQRIEEQTETRRKLKEKVAAEAAAALEQSTSTGVAAEE